MPKVAIDGDRCQGHGRCADLAPGYFDLDDAGLGQVVRADVGPDDADEVRQAVKACPENAITLSD